MKKTQAPSTVIKWWIFAAMTAAYAMIFIDISILPVALPTIQRELDLSNVGMQWSVGIYTLLLSVFVLGCGRWGDIWGLKRCFCLGILLFGFASGMCGLSFSEEWLICSRALQGIGGAFLIPATAGIVMENFPLHLRGKVMGGLVSISALFLAAGPLVGGSLTQHLNWRYIFWINVPISIVGYFLTLFVVKPSPQRKERFDLSGFILISLGTGSLILGIMQSQEWGWFSWKTGIALTGAPLFYSALYFSLKKTIDPIIDVTLMRVGSFVAGNACVFCVQFIVMVNVFWAIYFQNVLNLTPTTAGGYSFIANIPVLLSAPFGGFLVDRYGPKLPVSLGFSLVLFALIYFLILPVTPSLWKLLPTFLTFGLGAPLIFTPSYVSILNDVPANKRGSASGINTALRQFGATLGIAVFGTLFGLQQLRSFTLGLRSHSDTALLNPNDFKGLLAHAQIGNVTLDGLPPIQATIVLESALNSNISGFRLINGIAAAIALVGLLLALLFLRTSKKRG